MTDITTAKLHIATGEFSAAQLALRTAEKSLDQGLTSWRPGSISYVRRQLELQKQALEGALR
jgi:hypothetical protein